ARTQPAPDVEHTPLRKRAEHLLGAAADSSHAPVIDPEIQAGELERARQPQPLEVGGGDGPGLVKEGRDAWVVARALEVDVVALPALERKEHPGAAREPAAPHPRREYDRLRLEWPLARLQ